PHVNLLEAGAGPADDTVPSGQNGPLANGRSRPTTGPTTRQPAPAHPGASRVEPAAVEAMFAATGAQPAATGSAMEQVRAMRQSLARRGGDRLAAQSTAAMEPRTGGQPSLGQAGYPPQHGTGAHPGMAGMVGNTPTGAHPAMPPQGYPTPGQGQPGQHQGQPRDPAMGGAYEREAPPPAREVPPEPRFGDNTGENPGYGGNTGANPTFGASTGTDSRYRSTQRARQGSETAAGPRPQNDQAPHNAYPSPAPRLGHHPPGGHTLEEAVGIAHQEGNDFAES